MTMTGLKNKFGLILLLIIPNCSGDFDIFVNGKHVGKYSGSGSFGELALMYNTPRAATIVAKTDGKLWTVDRVTFKRIVLREAFLKRQLYESWLTSVPLLNSLSDYERAALADALVSRTFDDGACIIQQGEQGQEMYFIEYGRVSIKATGSVCTFTSTL